MKKQFIALFLLITGLAICISTATTVILDSEKTTHVVIGVVLSWMNILFYSFVSVILLTKKNIAWAMTIIVIKYLILVSVAYYIWASTDVVLVLVGVFLELILSALLIIPFKRHFLS